MKIKIKGWAAAIEDQPLRVVKTTLGMVNLQQATGWKLQEIDDKARGGYAPAITAFFALTNAGFDLGAPEWEQLLRWDLEDMEMIKEPGDERFEPQEADALDPQTSRADSDPGGDEALVSEEPTAA